MRHIILLDEKITIRAFEEWKKKDIAFWETYIGVTPTYEVIGQDYSDYPTYIDSDGDTRPTYAYLKSLNDLVVAKNGQFGYDFVMVMVHEDNWKSGERVGKGMWGTNYSYKFGKQCLEYCRWDKDNPVNTFGTAYHERHHSFDAVIAVELGVDIRPILKVANYDSEITHGKSDEWKYIRYQENTKSLKIMKPYLQRAFKVRQDKHDEVIKGLLKQILKLVTQIVYFIRMRKNKKDGIPR